MHTHTIHTCTTCTHMHYNYTIHTYTHMHTHAPHAHTCTTTCTHMHYHMHTHAPHAHTCLSTYIHTHTAHTHTHTYVDTYTHTYTTQTCLMHPCSCHGQCLLQAFVKELGDLLGRPIQCANTGITTAGTASSASAAPSSAAAAASESIAQQKSAVFQAAKLGFEVGTFCCSKDSTSPGLFRITSMSEGDCTICEHIAGKDGETTVVPVGHLLMAYRIHKGRVTSSLPGWEPKSSMGSPAASPAWELDCARGAVALALQEQFIKHKAHCICPYMYTHTSL